MDFLHNARKALDDFNKDPSRYTARAAEEARKQLNNLGQIASEHVQPAAEEALQQASAFTFDTAIPIAADAFQHLSSLSQQAVRHAQDTDWTFLSDFGEDAGRSIGATADEIWTALQSRQLLNTVSQKGASLMQNAQEHVPGMGDRASAWVMQHPKQAAALMACILAAPAAVAVTPAALGLVGFTAGGTVAGSLAAVAQAGIGNVAAKSLFAVLQSAGAGGYGLVAVKAIAGSSAMTGTCSAAAVGYLEAIRKEDCGGGGSDGSDDTGKRSGKG